MKTKELSYGKFTYVYDLVRQNRKTLSLTVYPDKRIVLKTPNLVSDNYINSFIKRKYSWLNKQLRFFEQAKRPAEKKEYVSGESFLYLGRQYKLIVKQARENKVSLTKGKLWVATGNHQNNGKTSQKLLEAWYRERAETILKQRFDEVFERFQYAGKPMVNLRTMKTRWGSCSNKGTITLNARLIHVPLHCIDYVIMHELCHLIEHNHSPKYYKLLDRMMPDWKKRKERLGKAVI